MKKILFTFVMIFVSITYINASGMTFSLSCPSGAAASSNVNCTVKIASTTSKPLCAISSSLNVTGGSFVKFTSNYSLITNEKNGFVYNTNDKCISSNVTFGTLVIKMPSSGSATVSYSKIQGSDADATVMSTASNVSATISVFDGNNNLSSLSVDKGTLSPSFSANTTNYTVNVGSNITSISIKATASSSKASVSGTGSKTLKYGSNKFTVAVKSQAGTTKNYVITVNRADDRSNNNNLTSLSISNVKITPSFSSNTTTYSASVGKETSSIQINATLSDSKSSFVSGYGPRKVNLNYGSNSFEVRVKAENESIKTYTLKVTREDGRSSNNFLKSLSISNAKINFDKNNTEYDVSVKNNIESVEINADVEDIKSTVSGIGKVNLKVGNNEFKINVKAENGSVKTYIINIKRLSLEESLSSNAYLSKLTISNYTIDFDKEKLDYVINLKDENKLEIGFQTEDETSNVNISGNENLKDNSVIRITVTSSNGNTKSYLIVIDKKEEESKSNNLIFIIIIIIEGIILICVIISSVIKNKKSKKNIRSYPQVNNQTLNNVTNTAQNNVNLNNTQDNNYNNIGK